MSLRIENWFELENLDKNLKKFLIAQLSFNAFLWNTLLEHFVNYLKAKEEINFTYNELLVIQNYAYETTTKTGPLIEEVFFETTKRFDLTIHDLYSDKRASQPILVKRNVYDLLFLPSNSFVLDSDIKNIIFSEEFKIQLPDTTIIPKFYIGIKLKYSVDENQNETFSLTFI